MHTVEELEVLMQYKTNEPAEFAHRLNDALRRGSQDASIARDASALDAAIAKGRCQCDMLFRAACLSDIEPFIVGNLLTYPAFMSTSVHEGLIRQHYPGALTCTVPAKLVISGVRGAAAVLIEQLPFSDGDEAEVLLGRGARFRIDSHHELTATSEVQTEFGFFPPPGPARCVVFCLTFEGY